MLNFILLYLNYNNYEGGASGDSLWTKFWLQVLATLGALFVAYLGYKWNKNKEQRIKNDEKRESEIALMKYVLVSNKNVLTETKIQENNLKNFVNQLRMDSKDTFKFKYNTSVFFDWYDNIDKVLFRNVFFEYITGTIEEKTELYKLLITRTIHLRILHGKIEAHFENFINQLHSHQQINDPLFKDFQKAIQDTLRPFNDPRENITPPYTEMIEIVKQYFNTDENVRYNTQFILDKYVQPLTKIIKENRLKDLYDFAIPTLKNFERIKIHFEMYKELFSNISDSYKEGHEKISSVIERMNIIPDLNN
jgi:hypothetical protein